MGQQALTEKYGPQPTVAESQPTVAEAQPTVAKSQSVFAEQERAAAEKKSATEQRILDMIAARKAQREAEASQQQTQVNPRPVVTDVAPTTTEVRGGGGLAALRAKLQAEAGDDKPVKETKKSQEQQRKDVRDAENQMIFEVLNDVSKGNAQVSVQGIDQRGVQYQIFDASAFIESARNTGKSASSIRKLNSAARKLKARKIENIPILDQYGLSAEQVVQQIANRLPKAPVRKRK
jgi:hypothetical protein